ncbi:TrlF family AAA-like ATPase [Providencia sp. PROV257]|uniref:TrlF family AAA-like ATPase n=1 Tax=Providencia sp. PROV257 TaxID=2949945 RepID=UPI00234AE570|nr:hypothetical protein [Providencia sp. PROV257]
MNFSKGSEWRKWDLHVHTPASVLNNQFGDWDNYVQELFRAAIRENIQAIGITDYYIPEGYRKLKKDYLDNKTKMEALFTPCEIDEIKKIYIFPNIEFRLSKLLTSEKNIKDWGNKFNYHLLLCGDLDIDDIESDIISQLQFEYDAHIGEDTEKRSLTRKNIEEFGHRLKSEHKDFTGSDFFIGACNVSIDESKLANILKNNRKFHGKYMLGLPSDEDLSGVSWNSQSHSLRKHLIKQCHFIFSSNPKTISFMLGSYDKIKHVKEFGSIKPCLWGSDAHSITELFKPDLNRFTWIKADLSFTGLKQVVYDPESRVRIQESNPQQKNDYQIIKRARYVDQSGKNIFTNEWINFNPDLTTIIGGKSSGKSLLLYNLAMANNCDEVKEKLAITKIPAYPKNNAYDFEVEWNNGEVCKLSDGNTKPITYIPQLYINHLAEKEGKENLNELISKILCQKESFKENLDSIKDKILQCNANISIKLTELYGCINKYNELKKEAIEIGIKSDIEKQIIELNKQIEDIRKKSGFTEDEQSLYTKLTSRKKDLINREEVLELILKTTDDFISEYEIYSLDYFQRLKDSIKNKLNYSHESKLIKGYFEILSNNLESVFPTVKSQVERKVSKVKYWLEKIFDEKKKIEIRLTPLTAKITEQAKLKEINKKYTIENEKLKRIMDKNIEIEKQIKIGQDVKFSLQENYKILMDLYYSIGDLVNDPINSFDEEIKVKAQVTYDSQKFDVFMNLFDRRANLIGFMEGLLDERGEFVYRHDEHAKKITAIYDKIRQEKDIPPLKTGVTIQDLLNKLYSDCFKVNYFVFYKNDEILQMSPGKRGLVLLSILLHLSTSEHPILIDQPEDNLDNRTIYDQLKNYIRSKKNDRQIIMVTHNANLVVSTDSECVIVANQAGQQAGNENERYQFEYCFGALENDYLDHNRKGILFESKIKDHVCHILEGGVNAFKEREIKYGMKH